MGRRGGERVGDRGYRDRNQKVRMSEWRGEWSPAPVDGKDRVLSPIKFIIEAPKQSPTDDIWPLGGNGQKQSHHPSARPRPEP